MKIFSLVISLAVCQVTLASIHVEKRASPGDVATVGYASINGGTSGGSGGTQITVSTLSALTAAVSGDAKKAVIISGTIVGSAIVDVGSNTSIIGRSTSSVLNGVGLRVINESNVIIRNIRISKVLADVGNALSLQSTHQVWIDHVDLSSDRDHDVDFYANLLDITTTTGVTVTNSKFYTHNKASVIGHADGGGAEDIAVTVTYASNYWFNLNSRIPTFRFGHGHIFNNAFESNNDGINALANAQLLVENNVWFNTAIGIYSSDGQGGVVARGNMGAPNTAPPGNFTTAPYAHSLIPTSSVRSLVVSSAGQTLVF